MRILLVDDDPICRKIVALRLKAAGGIEVVECEDGDDAWIRLKRSHFDGVVVDWQMPGKSGLEIVREIRRGGLRMPILMVTGESEKDRVIEAIQAGVSDYLIKPFDKALLMAKLGKFVELTCAKLAAEQVATASV
jgi:two-component system, chemotaxis family, chemotaxis protein CheY